MYCTRMDIECGICGQPVDGSGECGNVFCESYGQDEQGVEDEGDE